MENVTVALELIVTQWDIQRPNHREIQCTTATRVVDRLTVKLIKFISIRLMRK